MISIESVYKAGYLDGGRYYGGIPVDVPDESLHLNPVYVADMAKAFNQRKFFDENTTDTEKLHAFIRGLVTDLQEVMTENETLKKRIDAYEAYVS